MATAPLTFDTELLRRYDKPGPRYTSYPTAPQFHAGFDARHLSVEAARTNAVQPARPLSLYVHVPFCNSPCFYCGCNRVITRDHNRAAPYLERVLSEAALTAKLFDPTRPVRQVHLGGGTPNFLDAGQIRTLLEGLAGHFNFAATGEHDFSIEIDPRFIRAGDIGIYAQAGLNRASLGVQDFNPRVQEAVNRIQSIEQTMQVIDDCRQHGFKSVNVDLIYGLPRQTLAGFSNTLDVVLEARPDRLAIYGYAHLPEIFKAQRQIVAAELPDAETRLQLLALAINKLSAAGYRYIGMDHFALPEDDLARAQVRGDLQRNFMGYTTHAACDLIGLGVSAISHVGNSFSQNPRELPAWETAVDSGQLPLWRGMQMDADDVLRADIIQRLMCQGEVNIASIEQRHGITFATYFADALQQLAALADEGLVRVEPTNIEVTPRGRLLLRVVAMCFDRYLKQPSVERPRFSKVI